MWKKKMFYKIYEQFKALIKWIQKINNGIYLHEHLHFFK
jgi:hypothetical protein